jgi:hypothetical protein
MPDGTQEAEKEKEDSRALHQSFWLFTPLLNIP